MFKLTSRQGGKNIQKTKQLWNGEFNIVSEGLDEGQVVTFVDSLTEQHKASHQASFDSLSTLIKKAVADAEQISASVKTKAQTEAEEEAARIIDQAKQEAEKIKGNAEAAAQKEAEDIISAADRKANLAEMEARQNIQLLLLKAREEMEGAIKGEYKQAHSRLLSSLQHIINEGQNIASELKEKRERLWESKNLELKKHETALLNAPGVAAPPLETSASAEGEAEPEIASEEKAEETAQLQKEAAEEVIEQPVQLEEELVVEKLEEEAVAEKLEEPVQLEEKATVTEPAETTTEELPEQHLPEKELGEKEPSTAPPKAGDIQALFAGEIELTISVPVELKTVTKFYNYLQTLPDVKILYTRSSWDQGTTITVALDKPAPLISLISQIPGIKVTPELSASDKGTASSVLGAKRKGVKRIKLTLKE